MFSPIYDIHHRHRKNSTIRSSKILIERQTHLHGRRFRHSNRYAKDGIGTKSPFILCSVLPDHHLVDLHLIQRIPSIQHIGDVVIYMIHRLLYSHTAVTGKFFVSQFHGFKSTRGSPRGNRPSSRCPAAEPHFYFHRRIPSGIQNFSRPYRFDSEFMFHKKASCFFLSIKQKTFFYSFFLFNSPTNTFRILFTVRKVYVLLPQ